MSTLSSTLTDTPPLQPPSFPQITSVLSSLCSSSTAAETCLSPDGPFPRPRCRTNSADTWLMSTHGRWSATRQESCLSWISGSGFHPPGGWDKKKKKWLWKPHVEEAVISSPFLSGWLYGQGLPVCCNYKPREKRTLFLKAHFCWVSWQHLCISLPVPL